MIGDLPWAVSWQRDSAGAILATVEIEPVVDITVDYWVDARLVIGSTDISWVQGPYSTMDGLTFDVDLIFPVETVLSNPNLLADLCVDVRAYVDETPMGASAPDPARVAWVDGVDGGPWILDRDEATALAPLGVIGLDSGVVSSGEESTGSAPDDLVTP